MTQPSFFMRFYGVPESEVVNFMGEYKKLVTGIQKYSIGPVTQSVNFAVPGNSHELRVFFKTKAERDAAYSNPGGQALYKAKATSIKGATLRLQQKESPCFHNPLKAGS